jgi:signal transduction histidine kinase
MTREPHPPRERLLARFVLDFLPDPLVILDDRGRLIDSNVAAMGRERCDLPALFAAEEPEPAIAGFLAQLRANGRATRSLPGGDELPQPVLLEGFALEEHFIVLARDPASSALIEELQQSRRMETLGLMTARVAHDLNNLLTPILIIGKELRTELDTHGLAATLARDVESAASRAVNLVADLTGFARPRAPTVEIVSLNSVVSAMRPLLEVIAGKGVRLRLSFDERPTNVRVDRGRLEQALLNLATNSVNAMPHGGELSITTANVAIGHTGKPGGQSASYVVLVVNDTGIGMPEDVRTRAFDDFFTTRGETGGTGLGLTSVRHFVEQSDGMVALSSEVGRGTSVVIHLPQVVRSEPRGSLRPSPKRPSGGWR